MQHNEKALTVEEQVKALLSKGLVDDKGSLASSLESVSYHRLSAYWRPLRVVGDDLGDWSFPKGTKFSDIWERYVFDRQLRLLVLDAIERIEVAIRNDIILNLAVGDGPFGYLDANTLPNIVVRNNVDRVIYSHSDLLSKARSLSKRELENGNSIVKSFRDRYGDVHEDSLPYWVLVEIVELGTLCRFLWGAPIGTRKVIARKYSLKKPEILDSWMSAFRGARNNCAHHGLFYDREFRVKPALPNKKSLIWHDPVDIVEVCNTAFGTLTLLKYMLGYIAPQSSWAERLEALYIKHPNVDRKLLGYPDNWHECPIWENSGKSD